MPLQQISVSPLDWTKEKTNSNQQRQKSLKLQDAVFTSGLNPLERCPSQTSTLSNNNDICRICHCESEEDAPLIAPCYCAGSLRYVHQACLQQWIKSSDIRSCELCKFQFVMQSKLKPFNKWESLEMNGVERRKLLCSVTFHAVALTCVVWSLYVLVDRTVEEIHRGLLEWPFWTKLIVVAIGFAGGVVFMYIQCKAYLHLCRRWRAFNRVIYVQNAPEKVALPPAAAIQHPPRLVHQDSSFASDTCCGVVVGGSDMGRAHPMIINMDPASIHGKNMKTSLESSLMSKGECEPMVKPLPDGGSLGLGDLRVVAATSSGGIRYFDEAERDLNDDLPQSEEFAYEERHLLRDVEERSRLLGEVPGFECNAGQIVKAGGFTGARHTSHSNDKISKTRVSPSSSEDSFQLLQNQNHGDIVGNVKPASARPWTSLNSGSTRIDKPPPQQSARPKSSQGSQSPLLTTTHVTDDTK